MPIGLRGGEEPGRGGGRPISKRRPGEELGPGGATVPRPGHPGSRALWCTAGAGGAAGPPSRGEGA